MTGKADPPLQARNALDIPPLTQERDSVKYHVKSITILVLSGSLMGCVGTAAPQRSEGADTCRSFAGETVDGTSWSSGGDLVAVSTTGEDGAGKLRVLRWPSLEVVSEAASEGYGDDFIAVDREGAIYWSTWEPFSQALRSTTLWRKAPGSVPERVSLLDDGRYLSFYWGDGLVAWEIAPGDMSRLVRLPLENDGLGVPEGLTNWSGRASEYWIDRSGNWLTWVEQDEPGAKQEVVVRSGEREWRHALPGYGGRLPTVTADHTRVIYQRSETARLTVLDIKTGTIIGDLDEREFYGGELSSANVLAAPTAHGPNEPNELCVVDVGNRLASLTQIPEGPSPPPLAPPDHERREALRSAVAAVPDRTAIDLRMSLGRDWEAIYFFTRGMDNVTARQVLDFDFDLESAMATLAEDGVIVVLATWTEAVAWFDLRYAAVDTRAVNTGSFAAEERLCAGRMDGVPAILGLPGIRC